MKYSQLLKYVTPHRKALLTIVLLLLAVTAANLANPLFAGKLTEVLLSGEVEGGFSVGSILLGWLLLLSVRAVLSVVSTYFVGSTGAGMSAELRSRVYEHMQILPLGWFQERKQGDVLSLLSSDAELISRFVTNTLVQLLPQLLTLAFAYLVMAWLDPLLAIVALMLLPAYAIITRLVGRRIRPLSRAWIDSWSGLVAFVNENLGMMPALKAFGRESLESERFAARNENLLDVSKRQIWLSALLTPTIGLMAGAGALLLLWIGISHMQAGQLEPAGLVMLMFYTMLLTSPLSSLAGVYGQFMRARGAADRLLQLFDERPEPHQLGNKPLHVTRGEIEFRNITFAYPDRPPILRGFNLKIEAGETVALTGPNGSGKSTLVHLLLRFLEPSEGKILLDGQDISDVQLGSLRNQVGLVAQNTLLLNGTVTDNITYGQPGANRAEIARAASAARAIHFIESLPDGLDTLVGDHGVRLSGGQRQRLSMARTLLRNPPVLVLDEATAMFDPDGELEFLRECRSLLNDRTVILITHRPASLALADRIVHLPSGTASETTGAGRAGAIDVPV